MELHPVVGFRCWVLALGEPKLRSVAMRYDWPVTEAVATCLTKPSDPPPHDAPDANCRCGLHARTTIAGVVEEYPYYPVHGYWAYRSAPTSGLMCMGVVLMYGNICRGEKVIRAEKARLLCMTDKVDLWKERSGSNDPSKISQENVQKRAETLDKICEAYSVPMIPWAYATHYAAEFGEIVGKG